MHSLARSALGTLRRLPFAVEDLVPVSRARPFASGAVAFRPSGGKTSVSPGMSRAADLLGCSLNPPPTGLKSAAGRRAFGSFASAGLWQQSGARRPGPAAARAQINGVRDHSNANSSGSSNGGRAGATPGNWSKKAFDPSAPGKAFGGKMPSLDAARAPQTAPREQSRASVPQPQPQIDRWPESDRKAGPQGAAAGAAVGSSGQGADSGLPGWVAPRSTGGVASTVDSLRDRLLNHGITLTQYNSGEHRAECPQCHGGSAREKSLGITITDDGKGAVWNCFRATCGWKGQAGMAPGKASAGGGRQTAPVRVSEKPPVRPQANLVPLEAEALRFFERRGISGETLEACGVMQENNVFCPALGKKIPWAIAFPYFRNGEIINIKYRDPEKRFWQAKGAEKILYGLDDVSNTDEIVIVEGEIDKLSLYEAGVPNAVSVPDGAPPKASDGSLPPPEQDKKYSYMWNCRDVLDKAVKVVIATDNDDPGRALGEELSRRLGRERCYRVRWPTSEHDSLTKEDVAALTGIVISEDSEPTAPEEVKEAESSGVSPYVRKDANEVLMKDGPGMTRAYIEYAEEYPIRGLFRVSDFWGDIYNYYNLQMGDEGGVTTGWRKLDEIYRVVPGELSIVTGVPNSGKSEWIDALCVNLAESNQWTFAMCSMEKNVKDHARQLLEKRMRKPFFDLPYAGSTPRMEWPEVQEGMSWLEDRVFLIRCEDDELPSVDWVLNLAKAAVLRHGIRGLVIDPYNELDHQRPGNMTETEYVSQMLTKIKRFAQHHECHVWFVAHPRQMRDWKGEAPNLYDISGSAHFINKADCGIVVHRNRDPDKGPLNEAKILVRKVRNKAAGQIGEMALHYDRVTGRFTEPGGRGPTAPALREVAGQDEVDFNDILSKFNGQ